MLPCVSAIISPSVSGMKNGMAGEYSTKSFSWRYAIALRWSSVILFVCSVSFFVVVWVSGPVSSFERVMCFRRCVNWCRNSLISLLLVFVGVSVVCFFVLESVFLSVVILSRIFSISISSLFPYWKYPCLSLTMSVVILYIFVFNVSVFESFTFRYKM